MFVLENVNVRKQFKVIKLQCKNIVNTKMNHKSSFKTIPLLLFYSESLYSGNARLLCLINISFYLVFCHYCANLKETF